MPKIRRLSCFFRVIFQIAFWVIPITYVLSWVYAPHTFGFHSVGATFTYLPHGIPVLQPLTISQRLLGFAVNIIPMVLKMLIAFYLIKLFRLYEKHEIFTLDNVKYIRRVGITMLLTQVAHPFVEFATSAVLTMNNPPHHRLAEFSLQGQNIAVVLIGIVIILISRIMSEGTRLQDEQKYTV